jgi:hypothetical protein
VCRVQVGHEQGVLDGEYVGVAGSGVGPGYPGAPGITKENRPSHPPEGTVRRRVGRGIGRHDRGRYAAICTQVDNPGQQIGDGVGDPGLGAAAQAVAYQDDRAVLGDPTHDAQRVLGVVIEGHPRQRRERAGEPVTSTKVGSPSLTTTNLALLVYSFLGPEIRGAPLPGDLTVRTFHCTYVSSTNQRSPGVCRHRPCRAELLDGHGETIKVRPGVDDGDCPGHFAPGALPRGHAGCGAGLLDSLRLAASSAVRQPRAHRGGAHRAASRIACPTSTA